MMHGCLMLAMFAGARCIGKDGENELEQTQALKKAVAIDKTYARDKLNDRALTRGPGRRIRRRRRSSSRSRSRSRRRKRRSSRNRTKRSRRRLKRRSKRKARRRRRRGARRRRVLVLSPPYRLGYLHSFEADDAAANR